MVSHEFVLNVGMVVFGIILIIFVQQYIFSHALLSGEKEIERDAKYLRSIIYEIDASPYNIEIKLKIKPSIISVENGLLYYERDGKLIKLLIPLSVEDCSLGEVSYIKIEKKGEEVRLSAIQETSA